jgi:uncharacterized paraquat-inducible protein A
MKKPKKIDNPALAERMAKARRIVENPASYKICEGCDSIVAASADLCPNCHAYRFDTRHDHVVDQALSIGAREQRSVTAEDLG